jgi:hypothetical protein
MTVLMYQDRVEALQEHGRYKGDFDVKENLVGDIRNSTYDAYADRLDEFVEEALETGEWEKPMNLATAIESNFEYLENSPEYGDKPNPETLKAIGDSLPPHDSLNLR